MNYLVDTHTFLWTTSGEKLSKKIKSILLDLKSTKYVSLITFWEISLKFSGGKLDLKGAQPDDMPAVAEELDRMLAWQAIKNDYVLLTKDKSFTGYKSYGLKTAW